MDTSKLKIYPESAGSEREHAALESRLLTLRCDTLVYTFTEPYVGLHVP